MKPLVLHSIDRDTLMPISASRAARRQQIAALMRATAKASEANLPADERRQLITTDDDRTVCMVPGDDPRELYPPLLRPIDMQRAADSGAASVGASWSAYDWIRYCAPWLGGGILLGAAIDGVVRLIA